MLHVADRRALIFAGLFMLAWGGWVLLQGLLTRHRADVTAAQMEAGHMPDSAWVSITGVARWDRAVPRDKTHMVIPIVSENWEPAVPVRAFTTGATSGRAASSPRPGPKANDRLTRCSAFRSRARPMA